MSTYKITANLYGGDQVGPTITLRSESPDWVRNFVRGMEGVLDGDKVYVVCEEVDGDGPGD